VAAVVPLLVTVAAYVTVSPGAAFPSPFASAKESVKAAVTFGATGAMAETPRVFCAETGTIKPLKSIVKIPTKAADFIFIFIFVLSGNRRSVSRQSNYFFGGRFCFRLKVSPTTAKLAHGEALISSFMTAFVIKIGLEQPLELKAVPACGTIKHYKSLRGQLIRTKSKFICNVSFHAPH
jgi:hypothetical protein